MDNFEPGEIEQEGFQRDGFQKNLFLGETLYHDTEKKYDGQTEWVSIAKHEHLENKLAAAELRLASLDYKNPNSYRFRFHIGQPCWHITSRRIPVYKECGSCEKGKIPLKDGTGIDCPHCKGKSLLSDSHGFKWEVSRMMLVGQLRLEYSAEKIEEQYMCRETGVGSGSVYYQQRLFDTQLKAIEECVKRNKVQVEYRCEKCEQERTGEHPNSMSAKRHTREWFECIKHGSTCHYRFVDGAFDESGAKTYDSGSS